MKEIQHDIKLIRESQIRMEDDIKYHIRRTDLLQEQVEPLHKLYIFFIYSGKCLAVMSLILGVIYGIYRLI